MPKGTFTGFLYWIRKSEYRVDTLEFMEVPVKPHRDMLDTPKDAASRRALVKWVLWHPLWSHDCVHQRPVDWETNPQAYFSDDKRTMRSADETWETHTERDEGSFHDCLYMDFVYVNPKTYSIDDNEALNTKFQVWVEAGGWMDQSEEDWEPTGGWNEHNKWAHCHDMDLDCGGDTVEEALLELAVRVKFYYNDDGTDKEPRPERCGGHWADEKNEEGWESDCIRGAGGYCKKCGFRFNPDPTLKDVLEKRMSEIPRDKE